MGNYTKAEFNKLTIDLQIKFFNNELNNGKSISDICRNIDISYNTVRDRFIRNNYVFNKHTKQYESSNNIFPYDDKVIEKALEKIVFNIYNKSSNNNEISKTIVCNNRGNIINRSFRIYDDVLIKFIEFCESSNYNQYDILSTFILDGLNKYSAY